MGFLLSASPNPNNLAVMLFNRVDCGATHLLSIQDDHRFVRQQNVGSDALRTVDIFSIECILGLEDLMVRVDETDGGHTSLEYFFR